MSIRMVEMRLPTLLAHANPAPADYTEHTHRIHERGADPPRGSVGHSGYLANILPSLNVGTHMTGA